MECTCTWTPDFLICVAVDPQCPMHGDEYDDDDEDETEELK